MVAAEAWCREMWRESHRDWLRRNGQDALYRKRAIIPPLLEAIAKSAPRRAVRLIDIGAGDGRMTQTVLSRFRRQGISVHGVTLVDRIGRDLARARHLPGLKGAACVSADVLRDGWTREIPTSKDFTVVQSIFLMQELPQLSTVLNGVAQVVSSHGVSVSVVVSPTFAAALRRLGKIAASPIRAWVGADWRWSGAYPIGSSSGVFYLPHFQRHIRDYCRAFRTAGMRVESIQSLRLPTSREVYSVFSRTIYGDTILKRDSSVLIVARSQEQSQGS